MANMVSFSEAAPLECGDCGAVDFKLFVKGDLEYPEQMMFECICCGAKFPLFFEDEFDA
jgi:hypothetical protein